jgi:hypothetical protein
MARPRWAFRLFFPARFQHKIIPMRRFFIAVVFFVPSSAWCAGLATAARLNIGSESLVVGQKTTVADQLLDCKLSKVQHTIRQCVLKPALAASTWSAGHRVKGASVTLNFQGDVINMSVEYEPGLGADVLIADYSTAIGANPKTQYWADEDHLYASSIWIDADTEVEISRAIKGASDGSARAFVSRLSGNPLLSPDDAP